MFPRHLVIVGVLSLVLAGAGIVSATSYTFTQLGAVGTYTTSIPYAVNIVNGAQEVVGKSGSGFYLTNGGAPVVWSNAGAGGTATGANILAQIPGASVGDRVSGLDANGDLSGYSRDASNNRFAWFLPAGSGMATVLPKLAGSDVQVCPYSMNNSQQIVGAEGAAANPGIPGVAGSCQAVLWTQTGGSWGVSTLTAIAPGAYAGARTITNNGIIAGWSNTVTGTLSTDNLGYQDAVTWTNTGPGWVAHDLVNRSIYTLGAFSALAVNSAGTAVGYGEFGGIDPRGGSNAVKFNGDGTVTMLGNLGALGPQNGVVPSDVAFGINDSGLVVGQATTSSGASHAFMWDSTNGMQDMNTVFAGILPAGFTLAAAASIDTYGDIVGYGSPAGGGTVGFCIARPILPGDSNLDGTVDIADLSKVLANYDKSGLHWADGDFDGNGTVDIQDLSKVLTNYDKTAAASAATIKAVPEPATLLLLAVGLAGCLTLARRKRS